MLKGGELTDGTCLVIAPMYKYKVASSAWEAI